MAQARKLLPLPVGPRIRTLLCSCRLSRRRRRGEGTRHYLPLSSEARADQGCRKRRNQVPDWSEITCRFPPKSPAAFDRNQVPVCSDFCIPFAANDPPPPVPIPFLDRRFQPQLDQPKHCAVRDATSYRFEEVVMRNRIKE